MYDTTGTTLPLKLCSFKLVPVREKIGGGGGVDTLAEVLSIRPISPQVGKDDNKSKAASGMGLVTGEGGEKEEVATAKDPVPSMGAGGFQSMMG